MCLWLEEERDVGHLSLWPFDKAHVHDPERIMA